jgi:hypothetical protein
MNSKKQSIIKEILSQIYTPKPKDTKIWFTKSAFKKMGEYGLSEAKVKDAVLHGEYVEGKDNMISRKYNGYSIGVIAQYNQLTKTYMIISAWKRDRRQIERGWKI